MEYRNARKDPREQLRAAGTTAEECDLLVRERAAGGWSGQRVELNAFTSPRFIEFIEHQFASAGVAKVVPTAEALDRAFGRAWAVAQIQEAVDAAVANAAAGEKPAVPEGLRSQIATAIQGTDRPWDEALADIARELRAAQARQR